MDAQCYSRAFEKGAADFRDSEAHKKADVHDGRLRLLILHYIRENGSTAWINETLLVRT